MDFEKKNILIGKNTLIDKTADIGSNVQIGNNVIINSYVKIGNGCHIGSNVILSNKTTTEVMPALVCECLSHNRKKESPFLENRKISKKNSPKRGY